MDKKIALKLLSNEYEKNICLIENLKYSNVEFIDVGENFVCFKILPSNIVLCSCVNDKASADNINVEKLFDVLNCGMFTDGNVANFVAKKLNLKIKSCYQIIYPETTLNNFSKAEIKPLQPSVKNAELIAKNYSLNYSVTAVLKLLENGMALGAYVGDEIAGFIGMHEERSVGLLEVFEKFKRNGIGIALLSSEVANFNKKGFVPFGHIVTSNEKSIALHKKLGCDVTKNVVYWVEK